MVAAAEKALARQKFVTPIDVCLNIGWLQPSNVEDWRRGRVDDLDYFLPTHDDRSVAFLVHLQEWAIARDSSHSRPTTCRPPDPAARCASAH